MRGAFLVGTLLACTAATAVAQPPPPRRIVGRSISGHIDMRTTGATVDTAAVVFDDTGGGPGFTVEFVAQYDGARPASPPGVVDMIVTERAPGDDLPRVGLQLNGEPQAVVARPRSARSIVVSLSFDDFVKLASADSVVERAFDTELEFGAGPLRMLRTVAQRWSGR
jgi:hypothetical protein